MKKRALAHASLFSGIGGPEVAAAMLGWRNLFHCEINPFGKAVLDYWFPNSESYEDITKTDFRKWRGKVDVLTGGFPCQPFSYAGKRGGASDERYLWPEMLRVIDEIRPSWVVGENVAGIVTMVEGGVRSEMGCGSSLFPEGDDLREEWTVEQLYTIERVCRDFEQAGYSVQPVLIPAAAVGAPHRRDRVFFLASNTDDDGALRGSGLVPRSRGTAGLQERNEVQRAGVAGNVRPEMDSFASDTDVQRQHEPDSPEKPGEKSGLADEETRLRGIGSLNPERRWASFPTVSPVHRGNDGLSFPLDDLTIPETKWRTESLKAYGNAIVPQVMYEIFRAIEEAEKAV